MRNLQLTVAGIAGINALVDSYELDCYDVKKTVILDKGDGPHR